MLYTCAGFRRESMAKVIHCDRKFRNLDSWIMFFCYKNAFTPTLAQPKLDPPFMAPLQGEQMQTIALTDLVPTMSWQFELNPTSTRHLSG